MLRTATLLLLALTLMFSTGCIAHYAVAQEHPTAVEPSPEAKSTEAQTEPKHKAAQGDHEGGEDAEAALKESAMVRKMGSWLGIENPKTAYWVFTIINFAILALALGGGMKKLLPGLFRARSTSIQKSIEDARKASAEANARLTEIEGRLGRLDAEIASIRSNAEQQAKTEEERLRASTEEEKNKIVQAAEQEIAAAQSSAQRELKQFVAQLAVSLAEQRISVNDTTDRELVRSFTHDLGNGAKGGRA
jgi:F-type H+-transporting ATPase subunit b